MIDLRDEMYDIMQEFGQYGLLIRNDVIQTCSCVNTISKAPDDHCPICLGNGYINQVEKVFYRTEGVAAPGIMSKYMSYTTAGDISMVYRRFYFDFRVRPSKNDLMIVTDWSEGNRNIPLLNEYSTVYNLDFVDPLKGDYGRIDFFMGLGKTDGVNQQIKLHNVQQNAGANSYYITVRE